MFALQYKKKLAALLISSFCALYSFTFGQSDSSAIQAQVNYPRVIKVLREEVANNQKAFILQFSNKDNVQAFLEKHRSSLTENIFQTIQKGTSSEAILAIHQSYNDFLLHKINLIEAQLGQKGGLYSTRWNVLSTEDLTLLQGHASEQLKLVKIELGKFPNSTAPIELKSRNVEIKNWVDEITQELQTRKSSPHLKLVEIENNVSEAKMTGLNKVLSAFEGESGKQKFQIKLKFNLQLRLHGAANPSLESVTQLVNTSLETPEAEAIKLHDPQRGPPSTWENPYKDVKNIIKKASFQEFEALIFKDYHQLAEARSTKLLYQRWLQLSTEGNLKPISEFAYLEAFDLLELKQHYKNWYKAQLKSPLAQNTPEIAETQKAILEIHRQLSWPKNSSKALDPDIILPLERGPPPPDFSPSGGGANPDSPTGKMSDEILEAKVKGALKKTDLIDYEAKMPSIQQRLKLVELKKTLDRPSTIPDLNLRKQYNDLKNEILSTAKGKNQDLVLKELGQAQEKFAKSTSSITDFIETIKKTLQDIQGQRRVLLSSEPENIIQKKDIPFSKQSIVSESQNNYPEQFNKLFPKNATNQSFKKIIKNIDNAPGGVIIDLGSMDSAVLSSITEVYFDFISLEVYGNVKGTWKLINISSDPTMLRQAWAFAIDQRVVAIDLRGLSIEEIRWLIGPKDEFSSREFDQKSALLIQDLTKVNLHPVFIDTNIGEMLILADQVIFDLIPRGLTPLEGELNLEGINLSGLKQCFHEDQLNLILSGKENRYKIMKSIISVTEAKVSINDSIQIYPRLNLSLFQKSDTLYIPMQKTSKWFEQNEGILQEKITALKELSILSTTTGFFQWVVKQGKKNNLDELFFLQALSQETPELINSNSGNSEELIKFINRKKN